MIWSILISVLTIAAYLTVMGVKYGLRPSISTYHSLSKQKWLFSAVMVVSGGLLLPPMLEYGDAQFLAFFSGAAMLFVAASPWHKNNSVHTGAAIIAGASSALWGLLNVWWLTFMLLFIWAVIAAKIVNNVRKNGGYVGAMPIVYIAEVLGFANVQIILIMLYFMKL